MSNGETGTDEDQDAPAEEETTNLTRRRVVAGGAATWATVGLAGCNYITDPGPEDDGGNGNGNGNGNVGTPGGNTTVTNETTTATPPTTTEGGGGSGCASIRRFAAGMDVAMNVDVFDQETGQHLGADSLESVTVEFPNADFEPIELDWSGPHEEFRPEEWGGKLSTDQDVESGTYTYEIVVEGDGVDGAERIVDEITVV